MKSLVKTIVRSGFLATAQVLPVFSWMPKRLRIVMYHGVGDQHFSREAFEQQLVFIKNNFTTYWASEAKDHLKGGASRDSSKPPIILTFDDGLRNNKVVAAGLLEKHSLKATFYLCSSLMDGQSMLWNHELLCRLSLMNNEQVNRATGGRCTDNKRPNLIGFVNELKTWDETDRLEFLNKLRSELPTPNYSEQMINDYRIMSYEDAAQLPACIEVGSHTQTHPILNTISLDQKRRQVAHSHLKLTERLNRPIQTFCYPNGDFDEETVGIVQENYQLAVTTNEGFANLSDGLFQLRRIPSAPTLSLFVWRLLKPTA